MEISQLINEIAEALEIDAASVNSESDSTMIEEWDSLGHISILAHLDQKFDNITENCPELASATSVKEILTILNKQLN